MIRQTLKIATANSPSFEVVKGREEYRKQVKELSKLSWHIAHTALWNTKKFSQTEEQKSIAFIQSFIYSRENPVKAYNEFVQRVLLARWYIITHPDSYAPLPSKWLSATNPHGFEGTESWYNQVEGIRKALPLYKIQLRAFAEAIQEITETQNSNDFQFWRNYFIERNCPGLLNLFLITIANYTYKN